MRLIFFGTPDFAVPTLSRLCELERFEVVGVISQPDRARGRGRTRSPSPISKFALEHELPLWRPERVGEASITSQLRALHPDLGVVAAFGQFLPKHIRELPSLGYLINAHASLLPRHRGAAPIARAILEGDSESGISVMRVEKEMDTGAVCLESRTPIGFEEDAGSLGARLAELAAEAIPEALDRIAAGDAEWREQDSELATLAPKLETADRDLDFAQDAETLARRVQALAPTPGARSWLAGEALQILAARAEPGATDRAPGRVQLDAEGGLRIATGRGWLRPLRLQRAGGKALAVDAYLRGRPISDGAKFGER